MSNDKNKVPDIMKALQSQLTSSLEGNRLIFPHPVAKGDSCEHDWLQTLEQHLPHRYQMSRGFVIDSDGKTSEQIDLIIYDRQYTPLLFNRSGQKWIPAESVYAVFEVKQNLNRKHVKYAGKKFASVRTLKRTSAPIRHAGGTFSPRDLFEIESGILVSENGWTPPFGKSFTNVLKELDPDQRINFGCSIKDGAFEIEYPGHGLLLEIKRSDRSFALLYFFFNLLSRLQKLGTAPAIDYSQYLKVLN